MEKNLIKEIRERLGISQRELGEKLGIPKRTIENWESGSRKPPEWAEALLKERMEDMTMDLIIKRRHNADYDCEEYNCGKGWRTTLLGAMEEAGYPIKTQTLTRHLQSVAIVRGKDEFEAGKLAEKVEKFFGILDVPADLNPAHHASKPPESKKEWRLRSPEGKTYTFDNLSKWLREHEAIIPGTPEQVRNGLTQIRRSMLGKRERSVYQYKGWEVLGWEKPKE